MTDVSNTLVPVQEPLLKRADYDAALRSYGIRCVAKWRIELNEKE